MRGLLNDKVQAQSLVDAVAERLETAIVSGVFEPGSKLSEQALAKSLGVSRGPLREAIRRLEGRRLLQRTPNIGVRVATLSLKDLSEILQVQEALQGMACALAARNMPDEEIKALKKLVEQHGKQKRVPAGKGQKRVPAGTGQKREPGDLDLDLDFHLRIARGSRNKRLSELLFEDLSYLIWGYSYRFGSTPDRGRWMKALQDHKEIVAALARRDPVAAEQKMREHIRYGRIHMEEQLKAAESARAQETPEPKRGATRKAGPARMRPHSLNPALKEQPTNGDARATLQLRAASLPTRRSTRRVPVIKRL